MINTTMLKKIGRYMMIAGATLFTGGAGLTIGCKIVEKGHANELHAAEMLKIEEENAKVAAKIAEEKSLADIAKTEAYTAQLNQMDKEAFAKHQASLVAKANDDVLNKARRMELDAENKIVNARMEANDRVAKIEKECLKKIEAANKKADEAKRKYDALNTIFDNKEEVLKAKKELEEAAKRKKQDEELAKKVSSIVDLLE